MIDDKTKDAIISAMILKAVRGNVGAARIVMDEYNIQRSKTDKNAPIYELLRRLDAECGVGEGL